MEDHPQVLEEPEYKTTPQVRKIKRRERWRRFGPFESYLRDEFEEIAVETSVEVSPRRWRKTVPLAVIIWVTDLFKIASDLWPGGHQGG
jgi:hypothetical protein